MNLNQTAKHLYDQHQDTALHHTTAARAATAHGDHATAAKHHQAALEATVRANSVKSQLKSLTKPSSGVAIGPPKAHNQAHIHAKSSVMKDALDDSKHGAEPLVKDSAGPAVEQSYVFPYQSFCDTTLLQYALRPQTPNVQIVAPVGGSTPQNSGVQIGGYAVGALPTNETPLAIRFKSGGQQGNSSVMLLLPGQVITPHGLVGEGESVGKSGAFSAFDLGLPFGWLGGGVGTVVVLKNPAARVDWHAPGEVMYHQATYPIVAVPGLAGIGPIGTAVKNFPQRFPWPNGQVKAPVSGTVINQGGQPRLQIGTPTRTVMRLRVAGLAAPHSVYMVWQSMNPMDVGSDGLTPVANNSYTTVTWPTDPLNASLGAAGAWPYQALADDYLRMFADAGGVNLYDIDGTLAGAFTDIQRWGRL